MIAHAHHAVSLSTTRITPSVRMGPCAYARLPVNFISGVLDTVECCWHQAGKTHWSPQATTNGMVNRAARPVKTVICTATAGEPP